MKIAIVLCSMLLTLIAVGQEDCNNGIDDDGDGLIDCLDPDCLSSPDCPAFAVPGGCLPIGYYPSIIGNNSGFKEAGQIANTLVPISVGTDKISLIIQGVYQQGAVMALTGAQDLNYGEERNVWGRVEIDLEAQTSTGWIQYFASNAESRRYAWTDEALSTNMSNTYTTVGHDFAELTDFNFSFNQVGANLVVGCSEDEVDISYYTVEYGDFSTESLTRIEGLDTDQYPVYFNAGAITETIDLQPIPNRPNFIIIKGVGINQNRMGTNGVLVGNSREETMAIKYIVCDLNTMTASGNISVNGGNLPNLNTTFTFNDYDLTSNQSILTNATISGDDVGNDQAPNQICVGDMTLFLSGNQLEIIRESNFANDYNEMYYTEFLKETGQPYLSSFFITENAYSSPYDIGFDPGNSNDGIDVSGFVDFVIPTGSKRAFIEMTGNGLFKSLDMDGTGVVSNSGITNGNQMYAFTEINFDLNQTTGFYSTIATASNQQIYAWQNVGLGQGNINASNIYGQTPTTDERLEYELVPPNILRVHLSNDNVAYERIIQSTFLGSKVNLVYSSFTQNTSIFTGCDSVYFDMEICNSGGADLFEMIPVSFYKGDPTADANAIYLQTEFYNLDIDQGQCGTYTFGVDISTLGGEDNGSVTVVLNDNGGYSGQVGQQIPSVWNIEDLLAQNNAVLECEFERNIITSSWSQPIPTTEPSIVFNQNTFVVCDGEEETIEATVFDTNGSVDLQWLPGVIADTLTSLIIEPTQETWYYLYLSDACFDHVDSVKVSIGEVQLNAVNITDANNCPGQINPSLGELEVLPSNNDWTYELTGFPIQNNGNFNSLIGGQSYLLTVVNSDGCVKDSIIEIGLNSGLEVSADWIDASFQNVSCFGDQNGSAEIQNIQGGISGPYDVSWLSTTEGQLSSETGVVAGAGATVNNLNGGQWIVSVTDQLGCVWSQVFDVFEPEELILNLSNSSDPTCFGLNDGDLSVEIIGGNSVTTGVGSVSITNSLNEILNSGVSDLTINNLIADTYTVEIVDDIGCVVSQSVSLTQPDELDIEFTTINPNCFGAEAGFISVDTVLNYQGNSYTDDSLYFDWVPNPNGTNGIGINAISYISAGEYQLKITDGKDCYRFFDFELIDPDSIYFSELGFIPSVCRNQVPFDNGKGQVYAGASGGTNNSGQGGNFSYEWFEDLTNQTTSNTTWGNRNPGYYIITATNDLGCQISETIYLDSLSPVANFVINSDDFTADHEGTAVVNVEIENLSENYAFSTDADADTTFVWSFGFESEAPYITSDINEIMFKEYTESGVYEVCLIVIENMNGCVDTMCQEMLIHDYPLLVTPNIFTPGSDGINDEFFFPNTGITEFSCQIFDRWGKLVFEFINITDTWDGDNFKNNKECTDGVYFYTYEAESTNGTSFTGQGNVHLIRE